MNLLALERSAAYPEGLRTALFGLIIRMIDERMALMNNRRRFLQTAGAAAVAVAAGDAMGMRRTTAPAKAIELGLASYTLRNFNLDDTLKMTQRVGLKYIAFKSFHLALDSTPAQIAAAVAKVKAAGLILYGGGVITMKNEQQVNQAFDYAKAAGMKVIIGVPAPDMLGLVEKKVQQTDIKVAIHNHGPGDSLYPIPTVAYEKIKGLDKRIGLCHDVGHTRRYGYDPVEQTLKCADRMIDFHIKDINEATAKGGAIEAGRGVLDLPKILRAIQEIGYKGIVSFEYEKDAGDPLAGLAESVGYVKGILAGMNA